MYMQLTRCLSAVAELLVSRCLNVSTDGEEVMSEGKLFHTCTSDRKGATSNSRKSDGRNRQTIGDRGPKSLWSKAQNPLHQFPRNFTVEGKSPTCYGLITGQLV